VTRYLDVLVELDPFKLAAERNPDQTVAEIVRAKAEEQCLLTGARLRHSVPIEVYSRPGLEPLTGRSVVLVAARWVVDGGWS
jgi:hypothetical protein